MLVHHVNYGPPARYLQVSQILSQRRFEMPPEELKFGIREHALKFAKHQGMPRESTNVKRALRALLHRNRVILNL